MEAEGYFFKFVLNLIEMPARKLIFATQARPSVLKDSVWIQTNEACDIALLELSSALFRLTAIAQSTRRVSLK